MLNRRDVLGGLGAALASATQLNALDMGGARLITVSDGSLTLPRSFAFGGMDQDALAPILAQFDITGEFVTPECNLAVFQDGTNVVLFDVGSGPDFMPSAGQLVDSLAAVDLAPEDVTHVVFTHAHPDHIWGLIDDFDEPVFYEATYLMGRAEWDYWWNPETVNTIGEARAAFAVGAKRRMEFIEDQVVLFEDGDEVLPGVSAIATFGHTPGHMSFEVRAGSESALVIGDAIVNHHVALVRPEWAGGSDQDKEAGIASRLMLLDRAVNEQMPIVGFHLPDGGIGRVELADVGYRFVSEQG